MCAMLAALRSGESCGDTCQDEVTTLYQLTNCVHTSCTDCAAVHATVGAWEANQVRAVASPNLSA